ncbi:MAG: flagellar filament capping protein FliD [Oscillospiraceae bacterium]|nr:flagellar filament capping protein FliD [Oscillospiraceae bacterium]
MATNAITGLFSGMDTDSLVKVMVMSQQQKINNLEQKKITAEWKRDEYIDINNRLRMFTDKFVSVLGSTSMSSRSAYSDLKVNMTGGGSGSVVVNPGSSVQPGQYNVRVDQIATTTTMTGNRISDDGKILSSSEINGMTVRNMRQLVSGESSGSGVEFTINGVEFSFRANTSMQTIMSAVNSSSAGVTMSYSEASERFTITANEMGEKGNISVYDNNGFLGSLGLAWVEQGQDAVVYFNGEAEARSLSSNSLSIGGMQISFIRPTSADGVDFSIDADYQKPLENMRGFLAEFNTLMSDLFTAYNTKPDRKYAPLTENEIEVLELSDREIEKWEDRARQGLLYRDKRLGDLISGVRTLMGEAFGGSTLSSIGIISGGYSPKESTKLVLDEEKFLTALQKDPDKVLNILTAAVSDTAGGFVPKLSRQIESFIGNTKSYSISDLDGYIHNYGKRITEQEAKLDQLSERYYRQYAKMETVLSQLQSQQDRVMAMFNMNQ